jgi:hypothetical protein
MARTVCGHCPGGGKPDICRGGHWAGRKRILFIGGAKRRKKSRKTAGSTATGPSAETILLWRGQGVSLILLQRGKGKGVTAFKRDNKKNFKVGRGPWFRP